MYDDLKQHRDRNVPGSREHQYFPFKKSSLKAPLVKGPVCGGVVEPVEPVERSGFTQLISCGTTSLLHKDAHQGAPDLWAAPNKFPEPGGCVLGSERRSPHYHGAEETHKHALENSENAA